MTEVQKGKKFKSTSKTFHLPPFVYVDFRLWATANENKYHFWKISGTTGFRLNHCFTESQSKKSYFFRVPRVLPGDPPLTEEPENSGLEIEDWAATKNDNKKSTIQELIFKKEWPVFPQNRKIGKYIYYCFFVALTAFFVSLNSQSKQSLINWTAMGGKVIYSLLIFLFSIFSLLCRTAVYWNEGEGQGSKCLEPCTES